MPYIVVKIKPSISCKSEESVPICLVIDGGLERPDLKEKIYSLSHLSLVVCHSEWVLFWPFCSLKVFIMQHLLTCVAVAQTWCRLKSHQIAAKTLLFNSGKANKKNSIRQ